MPSPATAAVVVFWKGRDQARPRILEQLFLTTRPDANCESDCANVAATLRLGCENSIEREGKINKKQYQTRPPIPNSIHPSFIHMLCRSGQYRTTSITHQLVLQGSVALFHWLDWQACPPECANSQVQRKEKKRQKRIRQITSDSAIHCAACGKRRTYDKPAQLVASHSLPVASRRHHNAVESPKLPAVQVLPRV